MKKILVIRGISAYDVLGRAADVRDSANADIR